MSHVKSIALVGASGNVGSQTLHHLLQSDKNFNITVLTRPGSKATFPSHPSLTIEKGAYTDTAFVTTALQGHEVLILALGFMAMDQQKSLIESAVEAGVKWILPTEYAGDGMNEAMIDKVPLFWPKREARQLITRLSQEKTGGRTKWIGVATNPWVPFSLQTGMFGINPYEKKATLYDADAGHFNVSTLEQVGKGIAALLSLPIENEANPRASLGYYANNFVYISSALTSQRDLFAAALQATGTSEADWDIKHSSCRERLRIAQEKMKEGNMLAGADGTYAAYMGEGMGGEYEAKAKEDRAVLGLVEEEVEGIVRKAVELGPFSVMSGR